MNSKLIFVRWIKIIVITFIGLIFAAYLFLIMALKWTASGAGYSKEAHDAVYAKSNLPHKIKLIDSGILSLNERLKLIKEAKKSLELEFFIFNLDQSSRLVTQALLQKAKEGVQIRLLIDFSAPVFQLRPAYAKLMKNAGIQIKYYNTSPLYRLFSVQHRSHRKLLIADSTKVITGGRNIGDDYFDLSDHYNFLDSDLLVDGPIVETILSSFNLYWDSEFAKDPESLNEEISDVDQDNAQNYIRLQQADLKVLEQVEKLGLQQTSILPESICTETIFITDFPGAGEAHRKIYATIVELVSEAKNEIYVESPYFVLRQDGYDVFKKITDQNVKVKILTNSLYSTDAYYVISPLWLNLGWIADLGVDLFVYRGEPLPETLLLKQSQHMRWGVHAKRAVLDKKTVLLGTYNIDPRSANLNSELMLVCKNNSVLAEQVLNSIQKRIDQSALVVSEKQIIDKDALMKNSTFKQKLMTILAVPLASSFSFIL